LFVCLFICLFVYFDLFHLEMMQCRRGRRQPLKDELS